MEGFEDMMGLAMAEQADPQTAGDEEKLQRKRLAEERNSQDRASYRAARIVLKDKASMPTRPSGMRDSTYLMSVGRKLFSCGDSIAALEAFEQAASIQGLKWSERAEIVESIYMIHGKVVSVPVYEGDGEGDELQGANGNGVGEDENGRCKTKELRSKAETSLETVLAALNQDCSAWETIVGERPDNVGALCRLAHMYKTRGKAGDNERAVACCRRAYHTILSFRSGAVAQVRAEGVEDLRHRMDESMHSIGIFNYDTCELLPMEMAENDFQRTVLASSHLGLVEEPEMRDPRA